MAATTFVFAIGASIPLLLLAMVSQTALRGWARRLSGSAGWGKLALGAILVVIGLLILTGLDKQIEAYLVAVSPAWLTALTTSI